MIKNIAWDTKEKKISAVIFMFIISCMLFFEVMRSGHIEITDILLVVAAGVLFSLFFISSIEGKWGRIISAQGIISVLTVIVTFGMTVSQNTSSTTECFFVVFFASLLYLLAQNIYLLPVSAIIGAVLALLATKPEMQTVAMSCIPGIIGISFIGFSEKLKDSAIFKKIIFAVSQLVVLASYGYVVYCRRFMISLHSLITQVWDTAASFIAVVILITFAVYAIKNKKSVFEFIGYLVVALTGIIPMFMEMKYAFFSATAMFMVLLVASKEGSLADDVFNDAVKLLDPKNIKKAKTKKKRKI